MDYLGDYYLAHPFESRHEIRKWEISVEKRTGIKLFNPFYDIYREEIELIDKGLRKYGITDEKTVVLRDLSNIEKCKEFLAILDGNKTIGTFQEMVYAKLYGKITHLIITDGSEKSPWIRYHSNRIFLSQKAFEDFLSLNEN